MNRKHWSEDKQWKDYSNRFRNHVLPNLMSSGMFVSINTTGDGTFDVQQATEFGAAMLLGKPIVIVVPRGHTIPDCIRRAADYLFEDYDLKDQADQDRFADFIKEVSGRYGIRRSDA